MKAKKYKNKTRSQLHWRTQCKLKFKKKKYALAQFSFFLDWLFALKNSQWCAFDSFKKQGLNYGRTQRKRERKRAKKRNRNIATHQQNQLENSNWNQLKNLTMQRMNRAQNVVKNSLKSKRRRVQQQQQQQIHMEWEKYIGSCCLY